MDTPEQLLKAYEYALNTHNAQNLDGLIDAQAIFIFTDGTFSGLENIKSACVKTWDYFENEIYSITHIQCLDKSEQSASYTYDIDWSADLNGERQFFKGRGTTILKNTPNGWRIIHEHLSRMPETI